MEPQVQVKDHPARVTPHVVFGLIIIAVGVLFTLDNLGIIYAEDYWKWWPAGLIALGLAKLWHARAGGANPIGGVFFLLVGTWLLLSNLGYINRQLWNFWPLLLVFIGLMIVYQGIRGRQQRGTADSIDVISGVAILGGVKRRTNSTSFRGGELTAVMGGCEVDLRGAQVNGNAVIDVFAMWGGIEIRVPENWTVITKVTPLMGGVEDHTQSTDAAGTHRLTLRGMVIMGGVEIKN